MSLPIKYLLIITIIQSCLIKPKEIKINTFETCYDSILIFCTKCNLEVSAKPVIVNRNDGSFNLDTLKGRVEFYSHIKPTDLIRYYLKNKIKSSSLQLDFFRRLNNNSELLKIDLDTVPVDLRLLMILKQKEKNDTFIYFDKNHYSLNEQIFKTETNLDSNLINVFKDIENYCY